MLKGIEEEEEKEEGNENRSILTICLLNPIVKFLLVNIERLF
jgi:hypothetical protein